MCKFKRLIATGTASLALALTAGCAGKYVESPRPVDALAGPALWQLSDDDTTIYLFGTIHVLPEGIDWYDARIAAAFDAAEEVVVEVDLRNTDEVLEAILSRAPLTNGKTLRAMMSDENRAEYEAALKELSLPAARLDEVEPWFAYLTLMQTLLPTLGGGYQATSGVEALLISKLGDRDLIGIETIEEQIIAFDEMSMEAQLTLLDDIVESVPLGDEAETTPESNDAAPVEPSAEEILAQMVDVWSKGDAQGVGALFEDDGGDNSSSNEEHQTRLITDRNSNWVEWINQRLEQPGTIFIAVGAGHLAGEDSVQQQLYKGGIKVTRIWK